MYYPHIDWIAYAIQIEIRVAYATLISIWVVYATQI